MSLRLNMARNLQRLVGEIGSANFVSRELGINRQQFEKYLKARSLPSRTTLTRICAYFRISEEKLFSPSQEPDVPAADDGGMAVGGERFVVHPLVDAPEVGDHSYQSG